MCMCVCVCRLRWLNVSRVKKKVLATYKGLNKLLTENNNESLEMIYTVVTFPRSKINNYRNVDL